MPVYWKALGLFCYCRSRGTYLLLLEGNLRKHGLKMDSDTSSQFHRVITMGCVKSQNVILQEK